MLIINEHANGKHHVITHVRMSDLPLLKLMQDRINGEVALYSAMRREWVVMNKLDLTTAREAERGEIKKGR